MVEAKARAEQQVSIVTGHAPSRRCVDELQRRSAELWIAGVERSAILGSRDVKSFRI
jgi:hypothetical protein